MYFSIRVLVVVIQFVVAVWSFVSVVMGRFVYVVKLDDINCLLVVNGVVG